MVVNEVVKNRIIGAAVITSIAAIFVPMFFDEPVKHSQQTKSEFNIPKPKPAKEMVVPTTAEDVIAIKSKPNDVVLSEKPAEVVFEETLESLDNNQQSITAVDIAAVAKTMEYQKPSKSFKTVKQSEIVGSRPQPRFKSKPATQNERVTSRPPARFKPKPTSTQSTQTSMKRWVIQLASFGEQPNAIEFRDKLRDKGFTAYIDANKSGSKTIYRIKVGPELNKSRALKNKRRIERLYNINGLLLAE